MASLLEATTVKPLSSHTYSATFPENWCIGAVPHGGYICSTFMRVAQLHFAQTLSRQNQPQTMSLHLEYVRRTQTGPAVFTVRDIKLGRGTSTIHITLSQNGVDEVLGYFTNTNLSGESGVTFETNWSLSPPAPTLSSTRAMVQDEDAHWAERKDMPFSSFRKASRNVQFFFPREGQVSSSIADQWIRFRSGERFLDSSLGLVADMFPMIPEVMRAQTDPYSIKAEREGVDTDRLQKKGGNAAFWYPTLLLNLDVKKALPEKGVEWLFVRTRAKVVRNGRYDLEVIIMDEAGEVVALSHHVCMVLSSERNLAKRTEKGKEESKL